MTHRSGTDASGTAASDEDPRAARPTAPEPPRSPLVPLSPTPTIQTFDLGGVPGMVCDIDDPDCISTAAPVEGRDEASSH